MLFFQSAKIALTLTEGKYYSVAYSLPFWSCVASNSIHLTIFREFMGMDFILLTNSFQQKILDTLTMYVTGKCTILA